MSKRILFLVNHDVVIYNFRRELVEELLKRGYDVYISCPYGEKIDKLIALGAKYKEVAIERHGTNPFHDLGLVRHYSKLLKEVKPNVVLTYTIKPNIYGGFACKKLHIPYIANITGLGTAVEGGGILSTFLMLLYKLALKRAKKVFFQNEANRDFFLEHKTVRFPYDVLPGSGVNLDYFDLLPYPNDETIRFIFVGRIMKEKGIDCFLNAADFIKSKYINTEFHICGFIEKEYTGKLQSYIERGIVIYHGMVNDIREVLKNMHCLVFPSYYPEGISNVLLEAAACGRPIITTNRPGCKETVNNKITGYIVTVHNQAELNEAIERFIGLTFDEKSKMGAAGRKKVEKEFDRQIVVNAYLEEIKKIEEERNESL